MKSIHNMYIDHRQVNIFIIYNYIMPAVPVLGIEMWVEMIDSVRASERQSV